MDPSIRNGAEEREHESRRPEEGERERIIAEWAASGKTVRAMAVETGWSEWTLYRWRKRAQHGGQNLGAKPRPAKRALVAVPAPAFGVAVAEVMTRGGVVRLWATASPAWAGQLIQELNRC